MKLKLPVLKKRYDAESVYGKDRNILILLGISLTFSAILFLIGMLMLAGAFNIGNAFSGMDFIVFGLLTSIGPIGFYNHIKAKKIRDIETQLPDFLREISSATSSGMTVFEAIISSAKGDHGRLTPELEQMSAQISWGIPVYEALENFGKRINTPTVKRMAVTVNKALEIGGNTSAVFEAAAKEIDQVKLVEEQRRAEMSLYSIVIFISFFVFLAVILIINGTIFAEIFKVQAELQDLPSDLQLGSASLEIAAVDKVMLKNTFFSFILVQSIGGGLLGGFMMDGKLSSGVRFAFVLILSSFVMFKFLF
jgi:flagellar protein FlaJ